MDVLDKFIRSEVMSKIRSRNNKSTELRFRSALIRAGLRGWRVQPTGITGKPDFAFPDKRVAVFIDSCFWHGCPRHLRRPKSNRAYWNAKIISNQLRDRRHTKELRREGWYVLRIWEHDLDKSEMLTNNLRQLLTPLQKTRQCA